MFFNSKIEPNCCAPGASWYEKCVETTEDKTDVMPYTFWEGKVGCTVDAPQPPSPLLPPTSPPPSPPPLSCAEILQAGGTNVKDVPSAFDIFTFASCEAIPFRYRSKCDSYYMKDEETDSVASCLLRRGGVFGAWLSCDNPPDANYQSCAGLLPLPPVAPAPPSSPPVLVSFLGSLYTWLMALAGY